MSAFFVILRRTIRWLKFDSYFPLHREAVRASKEGGIVLEFEQSSDELGRATNLIYSNTTTFPAILDQEEKTEIVCSRTPEEDLSAFVPSTHK